MLPEGMRKADLHTVKRGGKQPKILSEDKVKELLNKLEKCAQNTNVSQWTTC